MTARVEWKLHYVAFDWGFDLMSYLVDYRKIVFNFATPNGANERVVSLLLELNIDVVHRDAPRRLKQLNNFNPCPSPVKQSFPFTALNYLRSDQRGRSVVPLRSFTLSLFPKASAVQVRRAYFRHSNSWGEDWKYPHGFRKRAHVYYFVYVMEMFWDTIYFESRNNWNVNRTLPFNDCFGLGLLLYYNLVGMI